MVVIYVTEYWVYNWGGILEWLVKSPALVLKSYGKTYIAILTPRDRPAWRKRKVQVAVLLQRSMSAG